MGEDDALILRFQRLDAGVWAWTRSGEAVAGASDANPRLALEEGLRLLRSMLDEGEVEGAKVRAVVEDARQAIRAAGDTEALQAADRVAGRFLWTVQSE